MADLFLHLAFARRLRSADGLHPIIGEALARRPTLVCFGAALAHLPQNELKGLSFFRRLFSRGGDATRWQKLLATPPGTPRTELIGAALTPHLDKSNGADGAEAPPGSMMRTALALGLLAHDLLEDATAAAITTQSPAERAAIERAQARLWLQAAVPNTPDLEREWRPVAELGETEVHKAAIAHLDRAILAVCKMSPGEAVMARWLKRLAADVAPVADIAKGGGLPPSLTLTDDAARAPHFDQVAFVEKVQSAVTRFVFVADRIAEQLLENAPPERLQANLGVALGVSVDVPTSAKELSGARERWREWLKNARAAALERGRNPKPAWAYTDSEPMPEQRTPSTTKVMNLADLPPETEAAGAPPIPEMSGPNVMPPALTQEVSIAQIEAEAAAAGFPTPAHTQEISAVQIEGSTSVAGGEEFLAPAHTQEVSVAQIEAAISGVPSQTQPISAEDVLAARSAEQPPEGPAGADGANGADGVDPAKPAPNGAGVAADAPVEPAPPPPTPAHTDKPAVDGPPRE